MDQRRLRFDAVDWLLLSAIAGLSAFLIVELTAPAIGAWRNRPRPGAQVCRQYVAEESRQNAGTGVWDGAGVEVAPRMNYLLYLPRDYSKEKHWPLVVFLHGAGQRGDDLEKVRQVGVPKQVDQGDGSPVASLILSDFVVVSPQCPAGSGWDAMLVLGMIEDICRGFSVDRERVYLTGHSMGGFATWEIARCQPDRFAAIAPLCGGGNVEQAERLKDVPVWAFHGANDHVVPLSESRRMVEAVRECGGCAEFTVFENEGHGVLDVTYQNPSLYQWLLAQRRRHL